MEYYAKLERGNATGVSNSILDAIAWALQLDEAERTHLSTSSVPAPRRDGHDAGRDRRRASFVALQILSSWSAPSDTEAGVQPAEVQTDWATQRRSAVEHAHLRFAVVLPGRRRQVRQGVELLRGELDGVGCGVLLQA